MNTLQQLGWSANFDSSLNDIDHENMTIGRVSTVNKSNCIVIHESGSKICELAGNLLFGMEEYEKPKTGDWVLFLDYGDLGIISHVLPRQTYLSRKKAGKEVAEQIIATNIDYAIVVQCLEIGLNLRRLERTLVQLQNCNIEAIILINKIDLAITTEQREVMNFMENTYGAIPVSANQNINLKLIQSKIHTGKSYVFIGASGVGKSSIINALEGSSKLKTGEISQATNKGAHTTTSRELYVLNSGGIVIDTPGTREFGLTSASSESGSSGFRGIDELAKECKFHNCTHTNEKGCKVLKAAKSGDISEAEYDNFMRLNREMEHYASSSKDRKQKGKHLSKIIKNMKKSGYKNR
ncbi:ribosome small subunit-dependent GTPase A [Marinifilum caeruleilacunae]|uniref:Small ribosomal subunit biogenesis GTPase RsgA n=1 Tax=Marinifilum caeruleilacunae TaxID=2499076 RepID=A0ABX1WZ33_9BACT|nr:ribosome small subunit-dependent GTPase A [Marinifilum caeruleilacunae]NOU61377.1 ribosome small subunit-dependent GTPase A [Marinifilum caeruleilacunae]